MSPDTKYLLLNSIHLNTLPERPSFSVNVCTKINPSIGFLEVFLKLVNSYIFIFPSLPHDNNFPSDNSVKHNISFVCLFSIENIKKKVFISYKDIVPLFSPTHKIFLDFNSHKAKTFLLLSLSFIIIVFSFSGIIDSFVISSLLSSQVTDLLILPFSIFPFLELRFLGCFFSFLLFSLDLQ